MDRPGGKKTSKSSNGGGGAAAAGGGGGAGGTAPAGGAGGGGAGGGGGPGGGGSGDDPKAPGGPAGKDEGKEGKDGAGEDQPAGAKPSSAGANLLANLREMANRVLNFSLKSDWPPVEGALKNMDRLVAQGATAEDGGPALPLAGLMDPVTGMTPLMHAVKENRLGLLDRLIEHGSEVSARNNENLNVLHIAAMHSREDVVKLLLAKKGVDVYATGGPKQQTAVHMVALRQTGTATAILRVLLAGAAKEIRLRPDASGKIPLQLAVESGNQSMVRELLGSLTQEQLKTLTEVKGDTALHLAARRRDVDMLRILVDYGANVDMQNNDGQTALHIASAEGDDSLVKYFYSVRASASITDNEDRTPMHLAAEKGHASVIELLADKFKASIYERTKDGSTLMHIASLNGHADCAMMLFKKGVYLHMPNKGGARSIHTAARYGHVGIISTLIQKGEKVDVTTHDNYTALHIAVESAKPAVVETLLGYGAEVHVRGGKLKETPLHIAARVSNGDRCALMLLKSGADSNISTEDGRTPVHVAAKHGNLDTLILLMEDGGDPLYKSNIGETPLHLACRGCHADVVQHLLTFVSDRKGPEVLKAYVNAVDREGHSALHCIGQVAKPEVNPSRPLEDKEVVKLLYGAGVDHSLFTKSTLETAFHYCSLVGNNDALEELLAGLTSTESQKAINKQNNIGWTPLLIAANKGHLDICNTLLKAHARVDVFDNEGRSALHLASERGFLEVCDALLTHKAFINSKSRIGLTALHMAATYGFTHLVRFLIQDHNAVIDILTLGKQTPLHLASAAGQLEVCRLLLELGASIDATDDQGQKPIHAAAKNNYPEVAQLFLQQQPSLVLAASKDGSTCAHIAAMQGSIRVIEELMKFDRQGVIAARNRINEATPLQLAAEGGHSEVVKVLVRAGASCADENKAGFTAVHMAARNGHGPVLEVLRSTQSLRISSKKLGVTALHVAAYFGQADTVRELLQHIPGTVKSDPPSGASLIGELGSESGMTPLHLAAYSGNENVVRLLLNSAGVQVDSATTENGYNPVHLACFGGHITVLGLLLARSADLLMSADRHGKTGLHIAATHGHYQMVEVLLGQGGEINATDKNGWTPLHCAARAGFYDVVKLLVESGASPKSETNYGMPPIWFAASEGHNDVLEYLMGKEHDTYQLMEDKRFVYNLMVCSKNYNNKPIEYFVLVSPAPVDTAAKLSNTFMTLSTKEKERAKDLISAGKMCETMATELLALAAGADSAGRILNATDRRNIEFLDVLIENEQKEVIAHTVVQRYLQELWRGSLTWAAWRVLLLFVFFLICPPVWVGFTLPLGHRYNKVPIIKFMSYLTSHIYLMLLLMLAGITPVHPVVRPTLFPYWYEWALLVWLSGLLLFELTNPSDKSGLGWIKVAVLGFGVLGVALHLLGLFSLISRPYWPTLMYLRNQLIAIAFLLSCVQILDFLSFHHLFGPWAIIIGDLMKDLARFAAVLSIFIFGFSMHVVALNQPFKNQTPEEIKANKKAISYTGLFAEVRLSPLNAFERLFFAVFGMTDANSLKVEKEQPDWTLNLFKFVFGIYMVVSVVVLINLLIAMMSDTYQRIQAQSDVEWKYGLAKLIRNMHRTTTTPSPLNLITTWLMYFLRACHQKVVHRKRPSLVQMMGLQSRSRSSARTKMGAKWLSKVKKGQVAPKDSVGLSVVHLSPLGSQLSFSNAQRIENVADWETIARKYRQLMGEDIEHDKLPGAGGGGGGAGGGNQPGSANSRGHGRPTRADANANSVANPTT